MRPRDLLLPVDPAAPTPLFLQIVEGIKAAIREGRLRGGEALPGTRALSERLGVHRNTVLAAYQELRAEGWVCTRPGGGTYVEAVLPESPAVVPPAGASDRLGFALPTPPRSEAAPAQAATWWCETGHADPRLLPMAALARAYRRALAAKDTTPLLVPDPLGHPRLREALGRTLALTRGLRAGADTLVVGGGVQPLLNLLAQAVVGAGGRVAVEALGHPAHWDLLRAAGLQLAPLPVDEGGVRVEALEALLSEGPLRAVLLTPHRQYPTGVPLISARRRRILELAQAHRFAILEVELDAGFQYEGVAPLPLAAEDEGGQVIYLGAFAKLLFPNLPLAYLHAPPPLVAHLAAWHRTLEAPGDPVLQRALAELLEDGELQRHTHRLQAACLVRRDALGAALRAELGDVLHVRPPAGGMAYWLGVRPDIPVGAWAEAARRLGVAFHPGRRFAFDGSDLPNLRLGFAAHREEELADIARRLRQALEPG
ncbi:MAG: PLP-dependent aminotransferase family protein [Acidobacteria bacterium]|nr:PLP-dependent aminotransferase family protein [Acidobacteriota bacterium]